ncbi:hypothetical protein [Wolbachia pipientis]|nr:hypothetical protein [Wolbachia pipientis]
MKKIEEQKGKVLDQEKLEQGWKLITDNLENFAAIIQLGFEQPTWELQRNIIRILIKQIEISEDNIYIVFRMKELTVNQNLHYSRRSLNGWSFTIFKY